MACNIERPVLACFCFLWYNSWIACKAAERTGTGTSLWIDTMSTWTTFHQRTSRSTQNSWRTGCVHMGLFVVTRHINIFATLFHSPYSLPLSPRICMNMRWQCKWIFKPYTTKVNKLAVTVIVFLPLCLFTTSQLETEIRFFMCFLKYGMKKTERDSIMFP